MTNGPGLQRELKLEMSNPVAGYYLAAINEALDTADDGVKERELQQLAPAWFLHAVASQGLYDRVREPRSDSGGAFGFSRSGGLIPASSTESVSRLILRGFWYTDSGPSIVPRDTFPRRPDRGPETLPLGG